MGLRRALALAFAVAIVTAGSVVMFRPSPISASSGAGTQTSHSFTYDGLTRSYLKYIPDGPGWNLVQQTKDTAWQKETFTLPAAAAGASGFRVRFRTNANAASTERADVDEVTIIGQ